MPLPLAPTTAPLAVGDTVRLRADRGVFSEKTVLGQFRGRSLEVLDVAEGIVKVHCPTYPNLGLKDGRYPWFRPEQLERVKPERG